MQIVLLLLFILQTLHVVQLTNREKRFINIIKRDVHSSSLQNLNRYIKTYETDQNIILNTPNFILIDSLLFTYSLNKSKSSVREHTRWLARQISSSSIHSNQYTEVARYDSNKTRYILHQHVKSSYTINVNTGQLTLINTNDTNLLYTEINLHAESGLSKGDDILHDIYRFIRLSTTSINCTTDVTVDTDESIEILCSIEYEFLSYDDLNNYQPAINLTFYIKQNNSIYTAIDQTDLNEIKDLPIDNNITLNWKRLISYKIQSINKENNREYVCIGIPDTLQNEDLFQDKNRICRTRINIRNDPSSTVIFPRLDQLDLMDILIIILIIVSILLFLVSFILCSAARQYHKKRLVQIKPEKLPLRTKNFFLNNNEIQSEIPLITSQQFSEPLHKPGCPKYIPPAEYNLLSSDLFTHTTIDNIKKIILPDIPENLDLFDDETSIHFYIPSTNENLSIKKDKSLN